MKIYFNNFWDHNNNICKFNFWRHLFSKLDYSFTNDIKDADVVIYSVFLNNKPFEIYQNKKNIFITFEPLHINLEYFDLNISHHINDNNTHDAKNIICSPQMLLSIYNNEIPRSYYLKNRPIRTNIPNKFCCFITRVEKPERIHFFHELSKYKQVDSLGECLNNTGIYAPHDRYEFEKMVSQYKFIITFENCQKDMYITEKILHGYYSMSIPIYWGSKNINNYFNPNSFIYIDNYDQSSVIKTINKIIEIDNCDELYLDIVNQPVFKIDIDDHFNLITNKIYDSLKE